MWDNTKVVRKCVWNAKYENAKVALKSTDLILLQPSILQLISELYVINNICCWPVPDL